jgi:PAS domain S-box-containing protein/excisionase family DNA binding protein
VISYGRRVNQATTKFLPNYYKIILNEEARLVDVQFYTVEEAAEILKTKISTIRNYCRDGKIPALKVGKGYRIARVDLEKWFKQQKKEPAFSLEEEQELLEAEAKYKSLFENASDAIAIFDIKGCLVLANPKFYEISGYTQKEAEGIHFAQLIHPEDLSLVAERFMRRIAGEDVDSSYEVKGLQKSGQVIQIEINSSRLVKEGRPSGVHVIIRDIGERKRAEEAIQESKGSYRSLFEDSPICLILGDFSDVKRHLDNLRKNGIKNLRAYFDSYPKDVAGCVAMVKVIDVNNAALELFQAGGKQEFKEGLSSFLSKELYEVLREELVAIAAGGTEFEIESVVKTLMGERRHIAAKCSVVPGYEKTLSKVIVSVIDITERKKAEEALRESEEMYKTLVKASPDAVTVTDLEGHITFVSQRALQLHGAKSAKELLGRSAFELIAPEDREKAMKNLKRTLEKGVVRNLEYVLLRKDGTRFIGELNAALIKDAYGKPKAFIATVRDISERKQKGEKQERMN